MKGLAGLSAYAVHILVYRLKCADLGIVCFNLFDVLFLLRFQTVVIIS